MKWFIRCTNNPKNGKYAGEIMMIAKSEKHAKVLLEQLKEQDKKFGLDLEYVIEKDK